LVFYELLVYLQEKTSLHGLELFEPMNKRYFLFLSFFFFILVGLNSQVVTTEPALPIHNQPLDIFLNTKGTELEGYSGDVYAHTGINNWQNVIGSWTNNSSQPLLSRVNDSIYKLELRPSIRVFYNIPAATRIEQIAIVFRSADRSKQTRPDIFIPVYEEGLNVSITEPSQPSNILEYGQSMQIRAVASLSSSLSLFVNNNLVASTTTENEIVYAFDSETYGYGSSWVVAEAADSETSLRDSILIFVRSEPQVAELPEGLKPGINYLDDQSLTLVLHDPPAKKKFVFVIGDFNDWMVTEEAYMNRTSSGEHFWLTISDLEPGREYGFQYFIDGELRLADPYTEKVLDPWNDGQIIAEGRYPGLIPYPAGKTEEPTSVFQTAREPYIWQNNDFSPPAVEDLVIYELLIRDFLENSTYKQLQDTLGYLQRLGVNAIELMPVTTFEGNLSWGYNPAFYFAPDKYYGPRDELKKFIDVAHGMDMAVIVDMVWNHSYGQSPLLRMYFDSQNDRPSTDNPWYSLPIFQNPAMNFGYKFDHGSEHFVEFMDRANRFWQEEYRVDGFRFDLTKGFTTKFKGSNDEWGSLYDQERVDNLKRLHDQLKSVNPNTYVILEHLADNTEEKALADYGMLLWGNMNHNYNEATMGYHDGGKSNLSWGSYQSRNWQYPHLITYMESHDEERLVYKNLMYGNSGNGYNIKELGTALRRLEMAALFLFTVPGPKMIWQFGELGYDVSINDPCRVCVKPVRWEYYSDWRRKRVYDIFSMLIRLKKENDVFRTNSYTMSVSGPMKRINLNHPSNQVTVIGNFGVTEAMMVPGFQQTGTWHEFFSRQTLEVNDINQSVTLQPGEYRLYSTLAFPDHEVPLSSPILIRNPETNVFVYPNPSTGEFTIRFDLSDQENIQMNLYTIQGKKISTILNQSMPPGSYEISSRNGSQAHPISPGIYVLETISGTNKSVSKLVIQ
jgi:1,4-alpha-glucan branching enzyme